MATVITNTVLSNQAQVQRQSIDDMIYMLAQEETPVLTIAFGDTSTGKRKLSTSKNIKSRTHEWQADVLEAADKSKTILEGATYDFGAQSQPGAYKNHTQINGRPIIVSDTTQATELVGRKDELARLKVRNMKLIKKDMEAGILANDASIPHAAGTGVKGVSGSLHTFLVTNVSRGATGANGGYNPSTGRTVAATDGTLRAFTETLFEGMLATMATNGAHADIAAIAPQLKRVANKFTGIGPFRQKPNENFAKVVSGVEIYTNPITNKPIAFVPIYNGRGREVFILTASGLDVGVLQSMQEKKVARDGEAEKVAIICEWTLIVRNEGYHAVIADLDPTL